MGVFLPNLVKMLSKKTIHILLATNGVQCIQYSIVELKLSNYLQRSTCNVTGVSLYFNWLFEENSESGL